MTQKDKVKYHLLSGKTLSPLQALNLYGCFRLGARIHELRKDGMKIENIGDDNGNFAVYRLKQTIQLPPAFTPKPIAPQQTLF